MQQGASFFVQTLSQGCFLGHVAKGGWAQSKMVQIKEKDAE